MSVCAECENPLVLGIDEDDIEPGTQQPTSVPDDLLLPCSCHFHWQCFMDNASDVAISLKCPSCAAHLPQNPSGPSATNTVFPNAQAAAIVTRYVSEGGVQDNYDILPDVTEEAYLLTNPHARPAHAFHDMCADNNVEGLLGILADLENPDEDEDADEDMMTAAQLLRYQDPLNDMKSALHIVIEKDQAQVALLLLWLASGLSTDAFPADAVQVAHGLGLQRPTLVGFGEDIRALRDGHGRTAEEYAYQAGGRWLSFIEGGMFL